MVQHALYHAGMALDFGRQVRSFLVNFGAVGNDQLVQHHGGIRGGFVQSEQAKRLEAFPRCRILDLPNICFNWIPFGFMESGETDAVVIREMAF